MIHFHKWLPWTKLIATYKNGNKQQWRVCATCNKAQFRTLAHDEQSDIGEANAAIQETRKHSSPPKWGDFEALRHSANEWADMATNGLQWMRNIVDGTSDPKQALANLEGNLKHCRATNDNPAAQRAITAIAAAIAAKPTTEVQND